MKPAIVSPAGPVLQGATKLLTRFLGAFLQVIAQPFLEPISRERHPKYVRLGGWRLNCCPEDHRAVLDQEAPLGKY